MRVDEARFRVMGCDAQVLAVGARNREARRVRRLLEGLELRWSRFLADSDISRLNRSRGSWVSVHADTIRLLEAARTGFEITGGRFDPRVLTNVEALGYVAGLDEGMPALRLGRPTPARGVGAVHVDRRRGRARLDAGVGFDPGGIGKGLAADIAVSSMLDRGAAGALVSIGGDMTLAGESPQGGDWSISVEDPSDLRRDIAVLHLPAGGVATSSALHGRWLTPEGPAPHVIDPTTGAPVASNVASVTVVAQDAATAEVAATAALVSGLVDGPELLKRLGLHGLMVDRAGRICYPSRPAVPA
ncbi:MAG: FAD:protein FMN transferase [Acidimicrobiia bacterium]|nr:FAD:protein FMN transferase [Acidimicrobiia bacterium]